MDANDYPEERKRCYACKEFKALSDFYLDKGSPDGHQNGCKECRKQRWYKDVENSRKCQRERLRKMRKNPIFQEREREYQKTYLTPDIIKAHHAINKLKTKPPNCTDCRKLTSALERHHEDYKKPLEVIWLCSPCHRQRTLRRQKCKNQSKNL